MNRSKLKSYAPEARKEFIQAVTDRAAYFGLKKNKTEPITEQGDTVVIQGRAFPKVVAAQRKKLEERISRESFDQVMEAVAYTWFNRFVAIRYMELHGYLDHGYRVLSHPEGESTPEILEHAQHLNLRGLNKDKVVELKLDGTRDEELYRLLLVAQCNALNKAMPFLFERVQDESELLLPDNMLHSNSLLRKLVSEVDEVDWQEVEIIGWIYQFYISERKKEVIGKVVKSEDIPAATQLFTPNWIVKYLVQNSIGRQWMATYPNSPLKEQMDYYIEPAEQTEEVNANLAEITPQSLNPEEMTLLDPACGSGHILIESYDLFRAIYQERGYRAKDIPRLILEKNLHGLEIDDRAAQLASFAVLMKARSADRHILQNGVKLNILSIQSSDGLDAEAVFEALSGEEPEPLPPGEEFDFVEQAKTPLLTQARRLRAASTTDVGFTVDDIRLLLSLFKGDDAKTFGSLIRIPDGLSKRLPEIVDLLDRVIHGNDLNRQRLGEQSEPIVAQSATLATQYNAVVTNPPYCGSRYMNSLLSNLGRSEYKAGSADMFAMFVQRGTSMVSHGGLLGIVCPFVWMFIATYESFRRLLLHEGTFHSMVRLEYNAFEPACVPVSAWTYSPNAAGGAPTTFVDLSEFKGSENQAPRTLAAIRNPLVAYRYSVDCMEFLRIPKASFAYAVSANFRQSLSSASSLADKVEFTGSQNKTGDNSRFVRRWWEVNVLQIGADHKWVKYAKGGGRHKWWGLLQDVVDWSESARHFYQSNKTSNLLDKQYWYRRGVTYSMLTSNQATFRVLPPECVYDMGGPAYHPFNEGDMPFLLALCNSVFAAKVFELLNPTLNLQTQDVKSLPIIEMDRDSITRLAKNCIDLARLDWDARETSSGFESLLRQRETLSVLVDAVVCESTRRVSEMRMAEEKLNSIILHAFGVEADLAPSVRDEEVTIRCLSREEISVRLISYSIGCMMGRYCLDKPGLIYAHGGNENFDAGQYKSYPADDDGVVPITDYEWFDDDATNRFVEFISVAWPEEDLKENLSFVAESLGTKRSEQPKDAIRKYLANGFFKDHRQTYKKRPIYWLFSSGKEKAFQALVYLHRYNEGTLARMRTEYVIPLQGKMTARIDHLKDEIASATSTSHSKKQEKEQSKLNKQLDELREFDEKLRHYADQRISLDLDDGVKVNYGKFGDLLAEVKAITGKKPDGE